MQDTHDLKLMLDSRTPLVVIETHEEHKATDLLLSVARHKERRLYRWSVTDGLTTMGFGPQLTPKDKQYQDPTEVLEHIKSQQEPGIYLLCDLHPYLADQPHNVRLLKDIALNHHFSAPVRHSAHLAGGTQEPGVSHRNQQRYHWPAPGADSQRAHG